MYCTSKCLQYRQQHDFLCCSNVEVHTETLFKRTETFLAFMNRVGKLQHQINGHSRYIDRFLWTKSGPVKQSALDWTGRETNIPRHVLPQNICSFTVEEISTQLCGVPSLFCGVASQMAPMCPKQQKNLSRQKDPGSH